MKTQGMVGATHQGLGPDAKKAEGRPESGVQRVAAKRAQAVLAAGRGEVLAIAGDVPVPVHAMRDKGGIIRLPLQFGCFRQYAD